MASHDPAYDMHVTFSKCSFVVGKKIGFSPVSGRAPLWSEGACGRDPRNKNKSSLRVVPNIITVPSSPLTHFYFTESTLNALYKVCMPCQNTCKMGSDRSVGRSGRSVMTGTGCWPLAAFARAMEKHDAADSHDEVILDCSYNFHGTRLATCAADHRVIVWDQGSDGLWTRECKKLEKHSSAVFKVDWAHPEYGQILASCSADRTVVIWEETQDRFAWSSAVPCLPVSLLWRPSAGTGSDGGAPGRSCRTADAQW